MKSTTRRLGGLLAAVAVGATLATGTASADPVTQSTKVVAAGTRLVFEAPDSVVAQCTLGAVGTDSQNRKVGITAGHCNWRNGSPIAPVQSHTTGNDYPVWDWNDTESGPIGWIRWVETTSEANILDPDHPDYMVIEFAPHVQLSSQLKTMPKYDYEADGETPFYTNPEVAPAESNDSLTHGPVVTPAEAFVNLKMNAVYTNSSGQAARPNPGTTICHAGAFTLQRFAQSNNAQQVQCGRVQLLGTTSGIMAANLGNRAGDSGGPVFVQNQPSKWAGIVTARAADPVTQLTTLEFSFHRYTSAKAILENLNSNSKVGMENPITGSGFSITNN